MGEVKQINIKSRIYYFYNDMINLTKNHTKTLVFTTLDILKLKNVMIMKVFTA